MRVQVAEVRRRGARGLLGVEPLVHPLIDAEAVAAGRRGHELPQALGACAGDGERVEAALDHRGEREILGQPVAAEDVADHSEVPAGAAQPHLDDLAPLAREPIEEEAHLLVHDERVRREVTRGSRAADEPRATASAHGSVSAQGSGSGRTVITRRRNQLTGTTGSTDNSGRRPSRGRTLRETRGRQDHAETCLPERGSGAACQDHIERYGR